MPVFRAGTALIALLAAAVALTACGHAAPRASSRGSAAAEFALERIVRAPRGLQALAEPQPNGTVWALAGEPDAGLFDFRAATGKVAGSFSVSGAARSVAESATGVLGLALATSTAGSLELLDGSTGKVTQTIALPAPARQVVTGGNDFYVLTAWSASASVTVVDSRTGKVTGTVPVPADAVSVAPDSAQASIYVLQKTGLVDEIGVAGGKITAKFPAGDHGRSIALSPDGSTLYVLKGTAAVSNVAVIDVGTESVSRVLPAPSHCRDLVVAPGGQLYEVVGTSGYGNIQVVAP